MDWLSHHLEQDLDMLPLTDHSDDLARLIASHVSSTPSEEKETPHSENVPLREIESAAESGLGFEISLKHSKISSWNISFGHSESYEELALPACTLCSKRPCRHMQYELVESLLRSTEDGLYPNVSIAQSVHTRKRKKPSQYTQHEQGYGSVDRLLTHTIDDLYPGGTDALLASKLSKNEAHIMAERRRRDKLNERFVALSAILPGLKKVDKATVLGDAIKYVRQLEEQLKVLEDKVSKGVISTRKNSLSNSNNTQGMRQPDIEVRIIGKNVLIHVHCDNRRSILVKAIEALERLPLSIVNASALSFSNMAMELTFTAQIEEDKELTTDDIVKALQHYFFGESK